MDFIASMTGKINKKGIALLLVSFLLIWILVINWAITRIEQNVRFEIEKSLDTVLDISAQAISSWSKQLSFSADFVANKSGEFRVLVDELLYLNEVGADLKNHSIQKEIRKLMVPVMNAQNLRGFFIISPDFINLSSSRDINIGTRSLIIEQEDVVFSVMDGETTLGLPQFSDVPMVDKYGVLQERLPTMFIYSPVLDEAAEVKAILAFRIDPSDDFTEILNRGRLGFSGETYAIDNEARLISESRFDKELVDIGLLSKGKTAILNMKILDPDSPFGEGAYTRMSAAATSGYAYKNFAGYNDYRGIKVVGTSRWLNDLGFGLITELDYDEAYAQLETYKLTIWGAASFVIVLVISLYIIFLRFNLSLEKQVSLRTNELKEQTSLKELAQEKRQEEENRSLLLLNSVSEGVYGLDKNGNVSFANPAAARMVGYTESELIGRTMHELIHHSYADGSHYPVEDCFMRDTFISGQSHHITDEVFWRKDGSSFPIEYYATPVKKDNEIVGSVVIFSDITERLASDRMKDEFVSTVSHELRTPLTSIKGSLQLIEAGVLGEVPEKVSEIVELAIRNSSRLQILIDDILDLSKLEQGKMKLYLQQLNLSQFLSDAAAANEGYSSQYNVAIVIDPVDANIVVNADENRLNQVLSNLISNAAKFSKPGGIVSIKVTQVDGSVQISVKDTGSGIPHEFRDKIFEKFTQSDSSDTRRVGGTGLGLSITKAIVELHGGSIGFESTIGEGTTFYFTLPA